jgi:hypothetical protein
MTAMRIYLPLAEAQIQQPSKPDVSIVKSRSAQGSAKLSLLDRQGLLEALKLLQFQQPMCLINAVKKEGMQK